MTFDEMRLSLQLLAEERVGAPMRTEATAKRAEEDRLFAAVTRAH